MHEVGRFAAGCGLLLVAAAAVRFGAELVPAVVAHLLARAVRGLIRSSE